MKHTLKEIISNDNIATLNRICNGKVFYIISVEDTIYELELDSTDDDWKSTYLYPTFKALNLMQWIRKGVENDKFIQLTIRY